MLIRVKGAKKDTGAEVEYTTAADSIADARAAAHEAGVLIESAVVVPEGPAKPGLLHKIFLTPLNDEKRDREIREEDRKREEKLIQQAREQDEKERKQRKEYYAQMAANPANHYELLVKIESHARRIAFWITLYGGLSVVAAIVSAIMVFIALSASHK